MPAYERLPDYQDTFIPQHNLGASALARTPRRATASALINSLPPGRMIGSRSFEYRAAGASGAWNSPTAWMLTFMTAGQRPIGVTTRSAVIVQTHDVMAQASRNP